ncbi:putative UBA-like superfamily, Ubiquitin-associated domain, NEDD8 ultimate buster 1 [Helianthus annuus]|nr:putative UBA-like superfamily, Ubiquitin-associated domain, NEDD8 ultimate buster 1 [Helianthus annuus]
MFFCYGSFEKELAAESLRRNENEMQKALDDLTNPDTNSDIQKRARRASDAAVERLVTLGFPREAVVAAVDAHGTEERALNHLLEQNVPKESAPPTGPVAENVGSSSGSGGASSSDGATGTVPNNGNIPIFDQEMERDVEMEHEITGDLRSEDVFSDYDMELTRESEAIEEYLALVLV